MNDMNMQFSQYLVEKTIAERQEEAARRDLLRTVSRENAPMPREWPFTRIVRAIRQAPVRRVIRNKPAPFRWTKRIAS